MDTFIEILKAVAILSTILGLLGVGVLLDVRFKVKAQTKMALRWAQAVENGETDAAVMAIAYPGDTIVAKTPGTAIARARYNQAKVWQREQGLHALYYESENPVVRLSALVAAIIEDVDIYMTFGVKNPEGLQEAYFAELEYSRRECYDGKVAAMELYVTLVRNLWRDNEHELVRRRFKTYGLPPLTEAGRPEF